LALLLGVRTTEQLSGSGSQRNQLFQRRPEGVVAALMPLYTSAKLGLLLL
jgi:hypothetical protein